MFDFWPVYSGEQFRASWPSCFFSFQNNPNYLNPAYKMDLDLWDFRKGKTCIIGEFHRTGLVICTHSKEGKSSSYSQINMVNTGTLKTLIHLG